jgi:hypothetical protein
MAHATQTAPQTAEYDWTMEVPAAGEPGDFELCPQGNHVGNIVAIFDVGTHQEEYKGVVKDVSKFVLAFELQKKKQDGQHFILSKSYTRSMHEKANWYKLVSGVMAKNFAQGEKFDPRKLLGCPCMILVTHSDTIKDGKTKTFSNIATVSQFPEGFPFPTDYRPPVAWSVRERRPMPATSWVPNVYGKSIATLVEESKEFLPVHTQGQPAATPQEAPLIPAVGDPGY